MNCQKININGKSFKYREVYHDGLEEKVLIAEKGLEKELITEDCGFRDDNAEKVDMMFYGYIDEDVLSSLSDNEIEAYIYENLD